MSRDNVESPVEDDEIILFITAGQVRGFTVEIAPHGTLSIKEPCIIMSEDRAFTLSDCPVVVVDRWNRIITANTIEELEAKTLQFGLKVAEKRYFPEDDCWDKCPSIL